MPTIVDVTTTPNDTTSIIPTTENISSLSVENIASITCNSIVEISTEVPTSTYIGRYIAQGNGSGIIISKDGYILTNNHVINGANEISVKLRDGSSYIPTVVGTDNKYDIAILKIDANNLTPATFGNSDNIKVGELAVVIGNPLGNLGGTVTNGIISALEREISLGGITMNLIQTNAAINPGNSGGGLFNKNGELVGIVIAKSSGIDIEGLGFAIPINKVKSAVQDIIDLGYVQGRPFLGLILEDSTYSQGFFNISFNIGAQVKEIIKEYGAEMSGIKVGDIIVAIDSTKISSASDVISAISNYKVGDKVKLGILRNNSSLEIEVELKEYKGEQ